MKSNKNNKVYKLANITKMLLSGDQLPDGSRSINPNMDTPHFLMKRSLIKM